MNTHHTIINNIHIILQLTSAEYISAQTNQIQQIYNNSLQYLHFIISVPEKNCLLALYIHSTSTTTEFNEFNEFNGTNIKKREPKTHGLSIKEFAKNVETLSKIENKKVYGIFISNSSSNYYINKMLSDFNTANNVMDNIFLQNLNFDSANQNKFYYNSTISRNCKFKTFSI